MRTILQPTLNYLARLLLTRILRGRKICVHVFFLVHSIYYTYKAISCQFSSPVIIFSTQFPALSCPNLVSKFLHASFHQRHLLLYTQDFLFSPGIFRNTRDRGNLCYICSSSLRYVSYIITSLHPSFFLNQSCLLSFTNRSIGMTLLITSTADSYTVRYAEATFRAVVLCTLISNLRYRPIVNEIAVIWHFVV